MNNEITTIGENIAVLRSQNNMSQDALADQLNISRQAVSNWERNKTQPDVATLEKISGLFNVSIDSIVKGEIKSVKPKRMKYDIAISLFYAISLFFSLGLFFVIGIIYNEARIWQAAGVGCIFLFFVLGLLSHAVITLIRKDEKD